MAGGSEALKGVSQYRRDGITHVSLSRRLAGDHVVQSLHRGVTAALPQYTGAAVLTSELLADDPVDLAIADAGGSRTPRWVEAGFLQATGVPRIRVPVIELPASKGRRARRGMPAVPTIEADELAQILVRDPRWPGDRNPPSHVAILTEGIDTGGTVGRIAQATLIATASSPVTPRIDVVTAHMEQVLPQNPGPADLAQSDDNLRRRTEELEEGLPLGGGHIRTPHIGQWESPGEHPALYGARGRDVPLEGPKVGSILSASLAAEGIDQSAISTLVPLGEQVLRMAGQVAGKAFILDGEEAALLAAREAVDEAFEVRKPNRLVLAMSPTARRQERDRKWRKEYLQKEELDSAVGTISARAMAQLLEEPGSVEEILQRSSDELTAYFESGGSGTRNQQEQLLKLKKGIVSGALQYRLAVHMLATIFEDPKGAEESLDFTPLGTLEDLSFLDLPDSNGGSQPELASQKSDRIKFYGAIGKLATVAHDTVIRSDPAWSAVEGINSRLDDELDMRGFGFNYQDNGSLICSPSVWDLIKNMNRLTRRFNGLLRAHSTNLGPLNPKTMEYAEPLPDVTLRWGDLQHAFFTAPLNHHPSHSSGIGIDVSAQTKVPYTTTVVTEGVSAAGTPDQTGDASARSIDRQLQIIKQGFEKLGHKLPEISSPEELITYIGAIFMPILGSPFSPYVKIDNSTGIAHRIEEVKHERERKLAIKAKAIAAQGMENLLDHPEDITKILVKAEADMTSYLQQDGKWVDDPDGYILRLKKGIVSSSLQYYVTMAMLCDMLGDPHAVVSTLYKSYPKEEGKYVAFALDGESGFTFDPYYEDSRHDFLSAVSEWATLSYTRTVGSSPTWQAVEQAKLDLTAELTARGQRESYSNEPTPQVPPTVWSIMKNMNSVLMLLQPPLAELNKRAETEALDALEWSAIQYPFFSRPGDLVGLAGITAETLGEVTPPNPAPEVTVYLDEESGDINKYEWAGRTAELIDGDYGGICFGFRALHRTRATTRLQDRINATLDPFGVKLPIRTSAVQAMAMVGALLQPMLAADYQNLRIYESTSFAHQLAAERDIGYRPLE